MSKITHLYTLTCNITNMAVSIEERVSKTEGIVSEHARIFDMIHDEISDVKHAVDNRINDLREDMNRRLDEAKEETSGRFDEMNRRFDEAKEETNRRFDEAKEETNRRFDETNRRIARLESRVDEMNKRIAEMDSRLTGRMDSIMKWIVAIQIPTWVMIITMWVTIILRIG